MLNKLFSKRPKWRDYLFANHIAGHTFYTYKNVIHIHEARRWMFSLAIKEAEYGITYAELMACNELTVKAIRENDTQKALMLQEALKSYMQLAFNNSTLFKMCDAIILMDNEPEEPDGEEWTIKKRQVFDNSDAVKGFFLTIVEPSLRDIQALSKDISIADYMIQQEVKMIEQVFLNMIGEGKLSNTTPD